MKDLQHRILGHIKLFFVDIRKFLSFRLKKYSQDAEAQNILKKTKKGDLRKNFCAMEMEESVLARSRTKVKIQELKSPSTNTISHVL